MAALPRVLQKIFGVSGNNGVVGSAQAGSPTLNNDIAVLQSLDAFSTGLTAVVQSGKKLPPLEEIQALFKITTQQIAYILENGIPEYSNVTTYYINHIVREAATTKLYKSVINNNTGNALSDNTKWTLLGDLANIPASPVVDATEEAAGIAEIATQLEVIAGESNKIVDPAKLLQLFGASLLSSSEMSIPLAVNLGGNFSTAIIKCGSYGSGSTGTHTFASPFPNECTAVILTATNASNEDIVTSKSNSDFTWANGGSSYPNGYWIAIGY